MDPSLSGPLGQPPSTVSSSITASGSEALPPESTELFEALVQSSTPENKTGASLPQALKDLPLPQSIWKGAAPTPAAAHAATTNSSQPPPETQMPTAATASHTAARAGGETQPQLAPSQPAVPMATAGQTQGTQAAATPNPAAALQSAPAGAQATQAQSGQAPGSPGLPNTTSQTQAPQSSTPQQGGVQLPSLGQTSSMPASTAPALPLSSDATDASPKATSPGGETTAVAAASPSASATSGTAPGASVAPGVAPQGTATGPSTSGLASPASPPPSLGTATPQLPTTQRLGAPAQGSPSGSHLPTGQTSAAVTTPPAAGILGPAAVAQPHTAPQAQSLPASPILAQNEAQGTSTTAPGLTPPAGPTSTGPVAVAPGTPSTAGVALPASQQPPSGPVPSPMTSGTQSHTGPMTATTNTTPAPQAGPQTPASLTPYSAHQATSAEPSHAMKTQASGLHATGTGKTPEGISTEVSPPDNLEAQAAWAALQGLGKIPGAEAPTPVIPTTSTQGVESAAATLARIATEVAQKIEVITNPLNKGAQEVRLTLSESILPQTQVTISKAPDGSLSINFQSTSPQSLSLLNNPAQLQQLEAAIREKLGPDKTLTLTINKGKMAPGDEALQNKTVYGNAVAQDEESATSQDQNDSGQQSRQQSREGYLPEEQ